MENGEATKRIVVAMVVAGIFALGILVFDVLAYSLCNGTISYAGFTVQSCKENTTIPGNVYWQGRMVSKVINGAPLTKLVGILGPTLDFAVVLTNTWLIMVRRLELTQLFGPPPAPIM